MHVCLFDIDGTLLNTGGAGQAAMEEALRTEFGVTDPTEGIDTAGRTDRAIIADLFRYHGIENGEETFVRFLAGYLRVLPETLRQREGLVLPGIAALLEQLTGRGDILLGLLTGNLRDGAQIKLEHYELHAHFRLGGFGDRHDDRDDVAREALTEVHRHRNGEVDLERVWVIGDTPSDVRCGRAIGARTVAVGTGFYPKDALEAARPDYLFDDFADPEPLLTLLTS